MANICDNTLYIESENRENLNTILEFFDEKVSYYDCNDNHDSLDIFFDSKWVFPIDLMNELYEAIPDKSDIYMRCLSVEYGCLYHALWVCDSNGWIEY